ncbi:NADH-ubiquinone oxidoreductase [Histoplasma capsulatum var. duboisii H88]|uniref:NADH-ubiquinone oxidoreductase n=1 Tax=Ajellomyces capsulatus (strain H88) TaxID=544711 RepID=A0A8A1LMH7_AJEC8|nr:NADH-ubiquinone oxidoreductase [Histoplasma capsulatum var. duboisii H88]
MFPRRLLSTNYKIYLPPKDLRVSTSLPFHLDIGASQIDQLGCNFLQKLGCEGSPSPVFEARASNWLSESTSIWMNGVLYIQEPPALAITGPWVEFLFQHHEEVQSST